jgi:hypothetical protein
MTTACLVCDRTQTLPLGHIRCANIPCHALFNTTWGNVKEANISGAWCPWESGHSQEFHKQFITCELDLVCSLLWQRRMRCSHEHSTRCLPFTFPVTRSIALYLIGSKGVLLVLSCDTISIATHPIHPSRTEKEDHNK